MMEINVPEMLMTVVEAAQENLTNDGEIMPVAFIFAEKGRFVIPMAHPDKHLCVKTAGSITRKVNGNVLITVFDGAMRVLKNPEDLKKMEENPETESPLSYPKSMRTECLVIQAVEFPSGKNHVRVITYTGQKGSYQFKQLDGMDDADGAILDSIKDGWHRMDLSIRIGLEKEGMEDLPKEEL